MFAAKLTMYCHGENAERFVGVFTSHDVALTHARNAAQSNLGAWPEIEIEIGPVTVDEPVGAGTFDVIETVVVGPSA